MAITGKFWSAILIRHPLGLYPLTFQTELIYTDGQQTLDDIATYYPSLTWDISTEISSTHLQEHYLAQYSATDASKPYDDIETAQTDLQNYLETPDVVTGTGIESGFAYDDGRIYVRFYSGAWVTADPFSGITLSGAPSYVATFYPDANLYNDNTVTPFGGYGNGLIRHQALYHYSTGSSLSNVDPIAGVYSDTPGADTGQLEISVVDRTFIWTPERDGGGGTPTPTTNPDGSGDGVTDNDITIRCWTYSLDGHDYYVLRVGQSETLVYDLTTGSWSEWRSPGRTNWRAHVGCNWVGMSADTFARGFGSDVVAGDDASGVLWVLDPTTGRDDRSTTGSDYITRCVVGGIEMTGRDVVGCGAVQMDIALGDPSQSFASITLETSDDFGHTWADQGTVETNAFDYSQIVEWRSLGQISAPGRLFRITDNGATVRISGCDMR